jgi:hypothetical protein
VQQRLLWPRPEVRRCQIVSGSSGRGTTDTRTGTSPRASTGTGTGTSARTSAGTRTRTRTRTSARHFACDDRSARHTTHFGG